MKKFSIQFVASSSSICWLYLLIYSIERWGGGEEDSETEQWTLRFYCSTANQSSANKQTTAWDCLSDGRSVFLFIVVAVCYQEIQIHISLVNLNAYGIVWHANTYEYAYAQHCTYEYHAFSLTDIRINQRRIGSRIFVWIQSLTAWMCKRELCTRPEPYAPCAWCSVCVCASPFVFCFFPPVKLSVVSWLESKMSINVDT